MENEVKKSNVTLIVLIVILIAAVLGLGVYIIYDKVLDNKESNNKNEQNTSVKTNLSNEEATQVLSSVVNTKFLSFYYDHSTIFGYGNLTLAKDLDNIIKTNIAIFVLPNNEYSSYSCSKIKDIDDFEFNYEECTNKKVSVETIKSYIKRIFGAEYPILGSYANNEKYIGRGCYEDKSLALVGTDYVAFNIQSLSCDSGEAKLNSVTGYKTKDEVKLNVNSTYNYEEMNDDDLIKHKFIYEDELTFKYNKDGSYYLYSTKNLSKKEI